MHTRHTMTRIPVQHLCVIAVLLLGILGCSHGGSPVDPSSGLSGTTPRDDNSSTESSRPCWGMWDIWRTDSGEYEVVALREAMYTVNVVMYLQPPAGKISNISVKTIDESQIMSTGRVLLDVTLTHPFPDYLEYCGFDVLGVFMHNGSNTAKHDSTAKYAKPGTNTVLSNADGYTRWMNRVEFTASGIGGYTEGRLGTKGITWNATLNPYKYFCGGLTATGKLEDYFKSASNVNNRGILRAGVSATRRYDLTFPLSGGVPQVKFQYAVVASWVEPINVPPQNIPGDFPPGANMSEPFYATFDTEGSTLYWNSASDKGGNLLLTLEIFDQGARTDPDKVAGQISEIIVESPSGFITATGNKLTFGPADWTTQSGTTSISQKFVLDCGAADPQGPNPRDNPILVAVRSSSGSYDTGVGTPHSTKPLRMFQVFKVPMSDWSPSAPGNVTNFAASDGPASLAAHSVELTWDDQVDADTYNIQRYDYDIDAETWAWATIHTALAGTVSWVDANARYCGSNNPIEYRMRAENEYGHSISWSTDTGYPKMRRVGIAFWCAADNTSGLNAVVTWSRAQADFDDCNSFWNDYGFDFVMENSGQFFWMTNLAYRDLTGTEDQAMHAAFGMVQCGNSINVYYVNSAYGDTAMAYCMAICPGSEHNTLNTFIVMGKDARTICGGGLELSILLAHENGHAMAHYWDVYLMDLNGDGIMNDGADCSINTFCSGPPPYVPAFYCDMNATYPEEPGSAGKVPKNLMWYSYCGSPVSEYDLTEGQYIYAGEWVAGHEASYPAVP